MNKGTKFKLSTILFGALCTVAIATITIGAAFSKNMNLAEEQGCTIEGKNYIYAKYGSVSTASFTFFNPSSDDSDAVSELKFTVIGQDCYNGNIGISTQSDGQDDNEGQITLQINQHTPVGTHKVTLNANYIQHGSRHIIQKQVLFNVYQNVIPQIVANNKYITTNLQYEVPTTSQTWTNSASLSGAQNNIKFIATNKNGVELQGTLGLTYDASSWKITANSVKVTNLQDAAYYTNSSGSDSTNPNYYTIKITQPGWTANDQNLSYIVIKTKESEDAKTQPKKDVILNASFGSSSGIPFSFDTKSNPDNYSMPSVKWSVTPSNQEDANSDAYKQIDAKINPDTGYFTIGPTTITPNETNAIVTDAELPSAVSTSTTYPFHAVKIDNDNMSVDGTFMLGDSLEGGLTHKIQSIEITKTDVNSLNGSYHITNDFMAHTEPNCTDFEIVDNEDAWVALSSTLLDEYNYTITASATNYFPSYYNLKVKFVKNSNNRIIGTGLSSFGYDYKALEAVGYTSNSGPVKTLQDEHLYSVTSVYPNGHWDLRYTNEKGQQFGENRDPYSITVVGEKSGVSAKKIYLGLKDGAPLSKGQNDSVSDVYLWWADPSKVTGSGTYSWGTNDAAFVPSGVYNVSISYCIPGFEDAVKDITINVKGADLPTITGSDEIYVKYGDNTVQHTFSSLYSNTTIPQLKYEFVNTSSGGEPDFSTYLDLYTVPPYTLVNNEAYYNDASNNATLLKNIPNAYLKFNYNSEKNVYAHAAITDDGTIVIKDFNTEAVSGSPSTLSPDIAANTSFVLATVTDLDTKTDYTIITHDDKIPTVSFFATETGTKAYEAVVKMKSPLGVTFPEVGTYSFQIQLKATSAVADDESSYNPSAPKKILVKVTPLDSSTLVGPTTLVPYSGVNYASSNTGTASEGEIQEPLGIYSGCVSDNGYQVMNLRLENKAVDENGVLVTSTTKCPLEIFEKLQVNTEGNTDSSFPARTSGTIDASGNITGLVSSFRIGFSNATYFIPDIFARDDISQDLVPGTNSFVVTLVASLDNHEEKYYPITINPLKAKPNVIMGTNLGNISIKEEKKSPLTLYHKNGEGKLIKTAFTNSPQDPVNPFEIKGTIGNGSSGGQASSNITISLGTYKAVSGEGGSTTFSFEPYSSGTTTSPFSLEYDSTGSTPLGLCLKFDPKKTPLKTGDIQSEYDHIAIQLSFDGSTDTNAKLWFYVTGNIYEGSLKLIGDPKGSSTSTTYELTGVSLLAASVDAQGYTYTDGNALNWKITSANIHDDNNTTTVGTDHNISDYFKINSIYTSKIEIYLTLQKYSEHLQSQALGAPQQNDPDPYEYLPVGSYDVHLSCTLPGYNSVEVTYTITVIPKEDTYVGIYSSSDNAKTTPTATSNTSITMDYAQASTKTEYYTAGGYDSKVFNDWYKTGNYSIGQVTYNGFEGLDTASSGDYYYTNFITFTNSHETSSNYYSYAEISFRTKSSSGKCMPVNSSISFNLILTPAIRNDTTYTDTNNYKPIQTTITLRAEKASLSYTVPENTLTYSNFFLGDASNVPVSEKNYKVLKMEKPETVITKETSPSIIIPTQNGPTTTDSGVDNYGFKLYTADSVTKQMTDIETTIFTLSTAMTSLGETGSEYAYKLAFTISWTPDFLINNTTIYLCWPGSDAFFPLIFRLDFQVSSRDDIGNDFSDFKTSNVGELAWPLYATVSNGSATSYGLFWRDMNIAYDVGGTTITITPKEANNYIDEFLSALKETKDLNNKLFPSETMNDKLWKELKNTGTIYLVDSEAVYIIPDIKSQNYYSTGQLPVDVKKTDTYNKLVTPLTTEAFTAATLDGTAKILWDSSLYASSDYHETDKSKPFPGTDSSSTVLTKNSSTSKTGANVSYLKPQSFLEDGFHDCTNIYLGALKLNKSYSENGSSVSDNNLIKIPKYIATEGGKKLLVRGIYGSVNDSFNYIYTSDTTGVPVINLQLPDTCVDLRNANFFSNNKGGETNAIISGQCTCPINFSKFNTKEILVDFTQGRTVAPNAELSNGGASVGNTEITNKVFDEFVKCEGVTGIDTSVYRFTIFPGDYTNNSKNSSSAEKVLVNYGVVSSYATTAVSSSNLFTDVVNVAQDALNANYSSVEGSGTTILTKKPLAFQSTNTLSVPKNVTLIQSNSFSNQSKIKTVELCSTLTALNSGTGYVIDKADATTGSDADKAAKHAALDPYDHTGTKYTACFFGCTDLTTVNLKAVSDIGTNLAEAEPTEKTDAFLNFKFLDANYDLGNYPIDTSGYSNIYVNYYSSDNWSASKKSGDNVTDDGHTYFLFPKKASGLISVYINKTIFDQMYTQDAPYPKILGPRIGNYRNNKPDIRYSLYLPDSSFKMVTSPGLVE